MTKTTIHNLYIAILCMIFFGGCNDDESNRDIFADTETQSVASTDPCDMAPRAFGCACVQTEQCTSGLLCDNELGQCRTKTLCDSVQCADGMVCQPVDDLTADCRQSCEPGFDVNTSFTACIPRDNGSCIVGREGSISHECDALYRNCRAVEGGARCGECFAGYTREEGVCRPVLTCGELGCVNQFRHCLPAAIHQDAACSECEPGYTQTGGVCVMDQSATCDAGPAGIRNKCQALNRYCVEGIDVSGAWCGECMEGYSQNLETGKCDPVLSCDELNCAAENRACKLDPYAVCTDCLPGTVKNRETGECQEILDCDDIVCPEGTLCEPAIEGMHAYCYDSHGCSENQIWNPAKGVCAQCPVCGDDEGESERRWPRLTKGTDRCICATKPGYFFSDSGGLQIFPCDRDGDGWVRADAKSAMEKDADDPIRLNARCDVHQVQRFVLENQDGLVTEVPLSRAAQLYEPTVLDDDNLLATLADTYYGTSETGRRMFAAELNPLTKACAGLTGDFNLNGIADIREFQRVESEESTWWEVTDFLPMTYFIELYNGWYEPVDDGGVYHIQEKRVPGDNSPFETVSIGLSADSSDESWQQCSLLSTAAAIDPTVAVVGMDFGRYEAAGMTLSKQFKCVVMDNDFVTDILNEPFVVKKAELVSPCMVSNCWAGKNSMSRPPDANPESPQIQCLAVPDVTVLEMGHVGWLSVDESVL
ncbi:MAG: hypothetical protein JXR76_32735 [Deltaproteobacteria bacterium]|nr:hypothetical protein [Deltaproteobacteria bacterium]